MPSPVFCGKDSLEGVRIATGAVRPRNDMAFARKAVQNRRWGEGTPPYKCFS